MARQVVLFTRRLKGWMSSATIPGNSLRSVTLTSETGKGWKASRTPQLGPAFALGDTITVEDQTFQAIGPTPLNRWNITSESNGWYRIEARQGEKRIEDGASEVRRVGWDSYGDRLTYGNIYKFSRRSRYSQEALNHTWVADYEMHCGKRADKPSEYEGSGPVKIMLENNQVRIVRQSPVFDGTGSMVSNTYGILWQDAINYHRLVAGLEYQWEFEVLFGDSDGYLRIWLTERDATGSTVITPRAQIVNYSGQLGYGAGRHPYHQERVYASDSAGPPIVIHKKPESYAQLPAPFVPVIDTFDGSALPASWLEVRKQTGTASTVVSGGALTIATGATPTGSSSRYTRPIPNTVKDGVKQYKVEIDYSVVSNGQSNLLCYVNKDGTANINAINLIAVNGSASIFTGSSGTPATLVGIFTVPADAPNPSFVLEGPASANRSVTVTEIRITEV